MALKLFLDFKNNLQQKFRETTTFDAKSLNFGGQANN